MDISAANWNEDDNANTMAAPDGAPEGMAPGGVNNVLRAHQGALKRFYNWTIPKLTTGPSTAYALSYAVAPGALVDGMTHLVQFHEVNGPNATLSVNNLTATPLHYHAAGAWRVAPPGLIDTDEVCRVSYHATSGAYRLLGYRNRTGELAPFAGSTAPAGALLCHGQQVNRTTYAGLFTAIGTTFNTGGEVGTDFRLPDLRGRVVAGKSDMGGPDAGNLTGGGTLGAALGAQTASLSGTASGTLGAIPVTVSGVTDGPGQASNAQAGVSQPTTDTNHTHAFTATGSTGATGVSFPISGSASTVQPTRVLNYLIRI